MLWLGHVAATCGSDMMLPERCAGNATKCATAAKGWVTKNFEWGQALLLPYCVGMKKSHSFQLQSMGEHIQVEALPLSGNHLNLQELLERLAQLECNEVLVEAGSTLSGAFVEQALVDEFIIYQAPILLGSDARPMINLSLISMADKKRLKIIDRRNFGDDQRFIVRIIVD